MRSLLYVARQIHSAVLLYWSTGQLQHPICVARSVSATKVPSEFLQIEFFAFSLTRLRLSDYSEKCSPIRNNIIVKKKLVYSSTVDKNKNTGP
jgi:hypothetical protein